MEQKKEKEDLNRTKKMIIEIPSLARFAIDGDKMVKTDAGRT